MVVQKGEWIKVEYNATLDDGTLFDTSMVNGAKPLKFQVGAGHIIKGLDESVVGKELGDEYSIRLEPSEAYGEYKEGQIHTFPTNKFPKDFDLQPGMMLMIKGPQGYMPASVKSLVDHSVVIDLNHPMAGKILNLKIKIVETNCEPDPT